MDLFGVGRSNFLDLHPALGRGHNGEALGGAIEENRQVEFVGNSRTGFYVDFSNALALGPGLGGMERHAQDLAGCQLGLGRRLRQLYTARLSPSARVNLRLDDHHRGSQGSCGLLGLGGRRGQQSFGHRDAEFIQQRLGLVFVNVHGNPLLELTSCGQISIWETNSLTCSTEASKSLRSSEFNSTSRMRSTPPPPITQGTPT